MVTMTRYPKVATKGFDTIVAEITEVLSDDLPGFSEPTDKVIRAWVSTFPADLLDFFNSVCLAIVERDKMTNEEMIAVLDWAILTRNPWTPCPHTINSIRRVRVVRFIRELKDIYNAHYLGDTNTVDQFEKVSKMIAAHSFFSHSKKDFNSFVSCAAASENLPMFGIMFALRDYATETSVKETANAITSFLTHHPENKRLVQVAMF